MKQIGFLLALFVSVTISAQDKAESIDELLNKYHEYNMFNGTALVAESAEVIFKEAYGNAVMGWDIPNTVDTKFRIGSISKHFTAAIILQLVEEGKVSLDGKITDYLPDYREDTGDKVTIHHLLTHTSGIQSYTNMPGVWSDSIKIEYDQEYFIDHFQSGDFVTKPGEKFVYNNTGYYLLGAIAERVTGKKLGKLLEKRILEPAGMDNSGAEDDEIIKEKMALGYLPLGNIYRKDSYIYMRNVMGAGHMFSTVGDMFKWDKALYGNKILSKESKEKMFTSHVEVSTLNGHYGYGWVIKTFPVGNNGDSTKLVFHSGGINGFNTMYARLPEERHTILLFNNTGTTGLSKMMMKIINILYGEDYTYPKKPIALHLYSVIKDRGVEVAIKQYKALKKEESESFNFSEGQLNTLGYNLMKEGKLDAAVEIFKLNIEEHPKSSNVYDSMGEAYMKKGNKDLAVRNYKKSLELNPANDNAIAMLKKLGVEWQPETVEVSKELIKKYEGTYNLFPNFDLTIRVKDGKLFAQATGQQELQIFPKSEIRYYYKEVDAQIEFIEEAGEVNKLILYQNNKEMPGKRVE